MLLSDTVARIAFGVLLGLSISGLSAEWASAEEPPVPAPVAGGVAQAPLSIQAKIVARALQELSLARDRSPAGKTIERIEVLPRDVVEEDDPFPDFLNAFHAKTGSEIVRGELLFDEGGVWDDSLISESERNLREYLFLSSAQIVAAVGSTPDRVVVVVVTKDLWSLRLNSDFSYVGSKLEYLLLQLEETNLFGKNQTIRASTTIDLATVTVGLEYREPRLFGSRLAINPAIDIIANPTTGKTEGGSFQLNFYEPLYRIDSKWGWYGNIALARSHPRSFRSGELELVKLPISGEVVPYEYGRLAHSAEFRVVRSYGRTEKTNLSLGWRANLRAYETLTPDTVSAAAVSEFRSYLPLSERSNQLFARVQFYTPDYIAWSGIDTFALTEDFRLGPELVAELATTVPVGDLDAQFLQTGLAAGYAWKLGDSYISGRTDFSLRYQPEARRAGLVATHWTNSTQTVQFRYVSPLISWFRFHLALRSVMRDNDLTRANSYLGGNGSLRGYPSNYFKGSNTWGANIEMRSIPWVFKTIHAGGAAFVDLGDAYTDQTPASLHASLGLGLRLLFPQFNRQVVRIDLGIPLESTKVSPAYVVAKFGQAF